MIYTADTADETLLTMSVRLDLYFLWFENKEIFSMESHINQIKAYVCLATKDSQLALYINYFQPLGSS